VLTPQTFALSSGKPIPDDFIYRINTGSPLPAGTDAVVMVEDTELFRAIPASVSNHAVEEEAEVKLLVGVKPGENVRHPGSDVRKDDMVLEQGTLLTSLGGEIGTLAFVGVTSVSAIL
jgi:gephyrin